VTARPESLGRLRLRLTVWYGGTFTLILLLLGVGLFLVVRRQFSRQLDASLVQATHDLERAAAIREREARSAQGAVVDAVDELHIPSRMLYLFDAFGHPVKPALAPDWVTAAARSAAGGTAITRHFKAPGDRILAVHAERYTVPGGGTYVAAAVADRAELEDEYASLITIFAGAALAALLLVAVGGWILVRQSTAPVERSLAQMRRFVADAAHELRTPVTVLRTRADVALQRERDPAAYAAALQDVSREAERLGGVVEDLLLLARADSGDRPLRRERCYLDDLALEAAESARVMAEQKGVALEVHDFEEAPVDGDPGLLRQLALILLDNAIQFTPRGGAVRLAVTADGAGPAVEVRDTGAGIAPEHLPHVFERFYRGDPARGRAEGAGLGLAIARWITELHGGEIALTSEVGRGTTVTVRLPPAVSSS